MGVNQALTGTARAYVLPVLRGDGSVGRQTISFFAGDDHQIPLVAYASDGRTPQNVTGWSFTLLFKGSIYDADAFALLSVPGVITAAASGAVSFTLTAYQSAALGGVLTYVVRAIDALGNHQTPAAGVAQARVA